MTGKDIQEVAALYLGQKFPKKSKIDQLAVKKLSTFLLSSVNRGKWLKHFNNAPKMAIEVEWRLRGNE